MSRYRSDSILSSYGNDDDNNQESQPLINAPSFISVVAPTEDIYTRTIEFYEFLGFKIAFVWDRTAPNTNRPEDICTSSERETWMRVLSDVPNADAFTIKIRYVQRRFGAIATKEPPKTWTDEDWRGSAPSFIFYTENPQQLVRALREKRLVYKETSGSNPEEVLIHDPTGALIGFSVRKNAFSRKVPPEPSMVKARAAPMATENPLPTSSKRKRIGVMTSGGDAPGMNASVRAVVRMSLIHDCVPFAIFEGYAGLVQGGDLIKPLGWEDVRGWLSEGGTLIGTARCKEFRERPGRLSAAKNMILNGIDALIVCGGDGSLTGADLFRAEWKDLLDELVAKGELTKEQVHGHEFLNIAGVVGSIDNDMASTDATIGAYTSLTRICEAVDSIDTTAYSHSRAFVVEVMGRHCGWLALMAGVATGADFVFMPERPPVDGWETEMCDIIKKHRGLGKRKTIVIVAEGSIDRNLTPVSAQYVKDILVERLGLDTRITTLGHVQRGGPPVYYDRMLATLQGVEAVSAVLEATPETETAMIAITENKITRKSLVKAVSLTKQVAAAIGKRDFDTAMALRDTEFEEYLQAYHSTTKLDDPKLKVPENKRMKIAIIHIGAPAGGMNAATRAAATFCLGKGHRPFAINNGFTGLTRHDSVRELDWLTVDNWAIRGGSEIGTNRSLPSEDMGMVAWYFQKHAFDGLLIIGGFEAFHALHELQQARANYPAFRIPMVCLPATISNNVPGTEFSLGSDTCLNALIEYCDAIKQSASASRRRVFVVEVQGGRCGYVATMGGLAVGALSVYTPEEGVHLRMLQHDIEHLKESFAKDQGMNRAGKLILRNERSSKTYSTQLIADMIREEANGRFESRTAIPGHVQQGGTPSPMDRVRAVRLAVKCIQFLEDHVRTPTEVLEDPKTASVIGIKGAAIVFTPITKLTEEDTDWKDRRPKKAFWTPFREVADLLSGRNGKVYSPKI